MGHFALFWIFFLIHRHASQFLKLIFFINDDAAKLSSIEHAAKVEDLAFRIGKETG
jgi:hypothetical protein